MSPELFANRPEAEVAVGYTATDTTLEVDDASAFPATGVFRVLLGNPLGTIFRVDSVAGDVFTGAAEAFDGNAAIGDTVRIVASKAVAERFLQSATPGEIAALSGVLGADRYGPLHKLGNPSTPSWAWYNKGGSTITSGGGVELLAIPNSTTSIRARLIAAPGTPYTIKALLRMRLASALAGQYAGLCFSDGTKIQIWYVGGGGALQAVKFTSATAFSGVGPVNTTVLGQAGLPTWLGLTDDGTDLHFLLSVDGVNWITYGSEARGTFFTTAPSHVGFFANVDGSAGAFDLSLISWLQS